jgi:hypothetical protein
MDFTALRTQVIELLQREQRLSYRALQRQFALDDEDLEALKDELLYAKRLAVDEDGRVLVWTGGTASAPTTASPVPPPATSGGASAQGEAALVVPSTPDAERRQLTVQAIMTVGTVIDPGAIAPAPNVAMHRYLPHVALLPDCALVVTHAGFGTVMAVLAHGVPLLCKPCHDLLYISGDFRRLYPVGTT